MKWFLKVLKNYIGFSGRARRKEYWMFILIASLITLALGIIEMVLGIEEELLLSLFSFAIALPTLAVTARRLHDTGRSGWWQLLMFVPLVGGIVLIIFTCLDSNPERNKYGENPKRNEVAY
ncbi:DUF805 domain-containing protein [Rossellomorea aquimaris]|uniref:DUF805 domain-containing protein n=1 Tax=Rossellomorea aquimaris TaxID=189382 RepID=UPI001CD327D7|nr:DUF805 domain-containing protein [Rossellomorea aquimaris]MCA1057596.1 DUF805 domain-containing protein [Rossellomorea aquimaris]